ncbi:MAG: 16S rRNA (guanine(527)-N(7))-methyltransferase RsmG [Thermoguttaceae bacterium]
MNEITDDISSSDVVTGPSFDAAWAASGISLPKRQREKIVAYANLLWDWNTRINLTRHTTPEKFVARDVVDAIKLSAYIREGEHVLDVGTGGGVPGVILAIIRPDIRIELCDATGKKANAVGEMLESLKLNVPIWHAKAENLLEVHRFTTIVIRAVSRLKILLEQFAPRWQTFDRMLLVKGPKWVDERGEARHYNLLTKLALRKLESYPVLGADGESVILQVCRREAFETLDEIIDQNAQDQHLAVSNTRQKTKGPGKKRATRGDGRGKR